jgi:proteic killer suppression protein
LGVKVYIEFSSRKLKNKLSSIKSLNKDYPQKIARNIIKRINQLQAFDCLAEVPTTPPFRRHSLSGKRKNQLAIDLSERYRIIFIPIYECEEDNENKNHKNVNKIKIMEVSNHYDD